MSRNPDLTLFIHTLGGTGCPAVFSVLREWGFFGRIGLIWILE